MLVVDFLHEFELGVWKALFVHLICLLYAAALNGMLVAALDERYDNSILQLHIIQVLILPRFRQIPPFGQTIRRFSNNVSEMKRLAARDFEDLLQVNALLVRLPDMILTYSYCGSVPSQHLRVF
jgi:hypothetical protein